MSINQGFHKNMSINIFYIHTLGIRYIFLHVNIKTDHELLIINFIITDLENSAIYIYMLSQKVFKYVNH